MSTPTIIPIKRAESSKINEKTVNFDVVCFPLFLLVRKERKKLFFFGKYQKYFISYVENIRNFTRLRTREITVILNTVNEIYLIFT